MRIETILANNETANIIRNLYPLYLYDLSEFNSVDPNEYGIYEEEPIKTLEEQYHEQDIWFQEPDVLFPFIIFKDKLPVGFILVSTGKYAPKSTDYYLFECFLLRPYRGNNIAEIAVKQVIDRFQGKWELYTNLAPSNIRAQSFWQKTINHYTSGNFERLLGPTFNGEMVIFRFNNKID